MTHEYTLLLDATILPGGPAGPQAPCEAIAWAGDTVLALGSTDEVTAISRGDSHVVRYPGRFVVPAGGILEVGGPADLDVLDADPRLAAAPGAMPAPGMSARVRHGRLEPVEHPG